MDSPRQWDPEQGGEDPLDSSKGPAGYQYPSRDNSAHLSAGTSAVTSLSLRETQEESLARLANPIGIVSSILAGALLALFLNPPQTIYSGYDSAEWIGCCKDMPDGTCYRFSVALIAFLFFACCCSIASLVFIVAASLKATAAARRTDKLEGSSAAIANFIASKWTLFACVYQAYIVMLLYCPIAYPLVIFILAAGLLGVGSLFTIALFWGNFWRSFWEDWSLLRGFLMKKTRRRRPAQQRQQSVAARPMSREESARKFNSTASPDTPRWST